MTAMSKIAIVQFKASTDKAKNLPKILRYIKQAAKNHADLCAFPEYMMFFTPAAQAAKQVAQQAETINGKFVSSIVSSVAITCSIGKLRAMRFSVYVSNRKS